MCTILVCLVLFIDRSHILSLRRLFWTYFDDYDLFYFCLSPKCSVKSLFQCSYFHLIVFFVVGCISLVCTDASELKSRVRFLFGDDCKTPFLVHITVVVTLPLLFFGF